ncbi:hypothetical protein [Pseudolysinimonas yzui]|jgi:hypothetical protein|uniref:Uncharacterized protein n=1 Tax=Pseudolysinimonas yzui TaxID=2708254 RepID=A0A8J3GQY0_9MICO|nr:hypothetical protein [Pseudolysinimonas yzui]GHF17628.1 hypothetical protein GCM10011600_18050 [Pseudolysinimonas yzui]
MELNVVPAIEGVFRVVVDGEPVGYVVEVGRVFVTLRGPVYNTSIEVGQSLEFEAAVRLLAREKLASRVGG